MSHFAVLVITSEEPTDEVLTRTLQPWHEFECTGTIDEHVQSVDRTDEAREQYESRSEDDSEETAAQFIEGWFGWKAIGPGQEPDLLGEHKYGYLRVDADGAIVQAIDRTNPNKKWDWWVVGGRWKGMLRLAAHAEVRHVEQTGEPFPFHERQGETGLAGSAYSKDGDAIDVCKRGDLDFARMKTIAVDGRRSQWNNTISEAQKAGLACSAEELDAMRREFYRARKAEQKKFMEGGEPRDRREHYKQHMPAEMLEVEPVFTDLMWPRSTDEDAPIEQWIAAAPALSTFAVVKDGQWYERGSMGWFGCVADEKDESAWEREFEKLVESVPPSNWLTVVDCHI